MNEQPIQLVTQAPAQQRHPDWSLREAQRAQYVGLVSAVAQGLLTHGGPNLPSATLLSKTFEYANALDAELSRQLVGRW